MLQRAVRFEPVDVLTSVFASLLAATGLFALQAPGVPAIVFRMIAVALVPLALAALRARFPRPGRALSILFDFYVIGTVLVIFDGLGPLIAAVHPARCDAMLIAFDRALFGRDPTIALERFSAAFLSDVLTICYALYYFHPIILGALLYADDRRAGREGSARSFRTFSFVIVFVFFVSYVGYFLVPAIGPRFTITHGGPLPRGAIARVIDATLDRLETNKCDCFPSGHTMVVIAVLIEAARRSRKTFLFFLPFAIGLVVATVYGRYHYVADVLGGLVLAFLSVPLAHALLKLWDQTTARETIR